MSAAYFDKHLAFVEKTIVEYEDDLRHDPAQFTDLAGVYFTIFQHRLFLLISRYSRGYPLEGMQADFLTVLSAWEQQRITDKEGRYPDDFRMDISSYTQAMWLVALAQLLHTAPTGISRLLACIQNEGKDVLFERLVARMVPDVMRKPAKKLLYPKAYQPLYDALDASADEQSTLMQQFLKNWYKRMSSADWYDAHKGPEGGGFDGYWCWEAAGVAHAFGIDDSSFRDLPYYPKDLADFARTTT
ncbi:PoNi-like cognate immunity protein [Hymenobacter terrenus]|uniref:PoNi-like cognate immunity protein n=1 Tax=Hymenobacter terrenus TaxID=1629124 RepID=UPI0018CE0536|nr:PoNi-like cognate immunity protein [Hymenobacter terrenus]